MPKKTGMRQELMPQPEPEPEPEPEPQPEQERPLLPDRREAEPFVFGGVDQEASRSRANQPIEELLGEEVSRSRVGSSPASSQGSPQPAAFNAEQMGADAMRGGRRRANEHRRDI